MEERTDRMVRRDESGEGLSVRHGGYGVPHLLFELKVPRAQRDGHGSAYAPGGFDFLRRPRGRRVGQCRAWCMCVDESLVGVHRVFVSVRRCVGDLIGWRPR